MKVLDKIGLVLFSTLILILSVLLCLMMFGWLDINLLTDIVKQALTDQITSNVLLGLSIVFILLAIKCIFFDSTSKGKTNEEQGVLLENENGKLMISKETLENLVNSVALNFEGTEQVTTRVELDRENNVMVYVNLMVSSNVIIKELSANLQTKIKEKIKTATDLDVKEVNITVKKVAPKEEQQEA